MGAQTSSQEKPSRAPVSGFVGGVVGEVLLESVIVKVNPKQKILDTQDTRSTPINQPTNQSKSNHACVYTEWSTEQRKCEACRFVAATAVKWGQKRLQTRQRKAAFDLIVGCRRINQDNHGGNIRQMGKGAFTAWRSTSQLN